jgi:lambda family phage portal protein
MSLPRSWNARGTSLAKAYETLRDDYNAAKNSRFRRRLTGVSTMGSGADYHYRSESDHLRMMELSRDIDRNDGVVGQGIDRVVQNVLQDGLRVDPMTGDGDLDALLATRWETWTTDPEQCHKAGEHDFHQLARLALRQTIVDGDIAFLPGVDGTLEGVEAHRLRTPRNTTRNVVHGIMLDEHRRHLEYWFTIDDLDPSRPLLKVSEIKSYPARDAEGYRQVFLVYNPKRISQTRGVTHLAPIVDYVGMHDDLQFTNLVRAQVAACFAIFREREIQFNPTPHVQEGKQTTETLTDGSTRTIEGISPGMDITGAPGEKLTGFSPNIPNPEFFPHAMMILTFIAINLGIPVQVLLLDPRETNFSGWRGAIDQARTGFREVQSWMISRFYRPVYRWKVRQWLAGDAALEKLAARAEGAGGDPYGHRWNRPSWAYIEPSKDAQADILRLDRNLISHRRQQAERGLDWEDVSTEIIEDKALLVSKALERAQALNAAYPEARIDWRELCNYQSKAPAKKTSDDEEGIEGDEEGEESKKVRK